MLNFISKIWTPHVYHGENRFDKYFEGWFYKMVSSDGRSIIAVINGIYKSREKEKEHAFIQVLNGVSHEAHYIKFDVGDFSHDNSDFKIKIGGSTFTQEYIDLNIQHEHIKLEGRVDFRNLYPWPVKLFSPGVMGWYSFVPFMECNHGVLSMDHKLDGQLRLNGIPQVFDDGRGYIEKDWGTSFPGSYVWIQSNNFEKDGVSFSGSIAKIPWIGRWFRGFIIGMLVNDNLYRFTTYTGAKLNNLTLIDNNVTIDVEDKKYQLLVNARRIDSAIIYGPYDNEMLPKVTESLNSEVDVKLLDKKGNRIIYEGKGYYAGLDINGTVEEILD